MLNLSLSNVCETGGRGIRAFLDFVAKTTFYYHPFWEHYLSSDTTSIKSSTWRSGIHIC